MALCFAIPEGRAFHALGQKGPASPEYPSVVVLCFAIPGGSRDSPTVFATVVTLALVVSSAPGQEDPASPRDPSTSDSVFAVRSHEVELHQQALRLLYRRRRSRRLLRAEKTTGSWRGSRRSARQFAAGFHLRHYLQHFLQLSLHLRHAVPEGVAIALAPVRPTSQPQRTGPSLRPVGAMERAMPLTTWVKWDSISTQAKKA